MRRLVCFAGIVLALVLLELAPLAQAVQKQQSGIPSGTTIEVRLNNQLDTGETAAGQTFTGTIAQPVVVGSRTVLARGATVRGRVTEVVSSGRLKRPASITLVLTSYATQPLQIDGKSHLLRNVALIGGGAGAGAAVGGATGGKKGAALGAAIGAGAGTVTAYLTGKQEIVLPAETVLPFVAGNAAVAAAAAATTPRTERVVGKTSEGGEVHRGTVAGAAAVVQVIFTPRDQELVRAYYRGGRGLPPGLAKRGGRLPPGLEKQLRKNGTLPPGLQKRIEPFPPALVQQLSPIPTGFSRVFVAGRALILDRNNKIFDLLAIAE
jgi:hypothetical protein